VLERAGRDLGKGLAETIEPALVNTLAEVDARLTKHEDRIGNISQGLIREVDESLAQRVSQVDTSLQARITQLEIAASSTTARALDQVDSVLREQLVRVDEISSKRVRQVGKEARATLDHADDILRARTASLERSVQAALARADEALAARIEQIDEAAGRRLGNVDVIASKQRILLERTIVRVAVVVGVVAFLVFVLKKLWDQYRVLSTTGLEQVRGAARSWTLLTRLGRPLVGQTLVAMLAGGVLWLLYDRLPLGAEREAAELARHYERQLESSLARFEFVRVRYNASQLEYLTVDDADRYGMLAAKADLLRDLFARPTLWGTPLGQADLRAREQAVERLLQGRVDPDLLVVEATLEWRSAGSRADEHRAASLSGRALRLAPRGFPLAPLARAYVETYLHAPNVVGPFEMGRDALTEAELRETLAASTAEESGFPLALTLQLSRRMRRADRAASDAYADLVLAHARADRAARTQAAERVLAEYAALDADLQDWAGISEGPAALMLFRLNDAYFARAAWYARNTDATREAPLLSELASDADGIALRIAMAPPRVTWARRYQNLLSGPALGVMQFQESQRFATWERDCRELERALARATTSERENAAAALAAARLGLFVSAADSAERRVSFARQLVPPPPSGGTTPNMENEVPVMSDLDRALLTRGASLL
jgi:hypothetical protein